LVLKLKEHARAHTHTHTRARARARTKNTRHGYLIKLIYFLKEKGHKSKTSKTSGVAHVCLWFI